MSLQGLAEALWAAEKSASPIPPLSAGGPLTLDDAYAIQQLNVERALAGGRRLVGHKVGLTSKAMQDLLGVSEPDFGVLLDDMVIADGGDVDLRHLLQPKAEAEIAFVLSAPLRGPGVTVDDVLAATEAVLPSIEVVDSRIRDWEITLVDTVADNGSSARVVLGADRRPPAGLDLAAVECAVELNGEVVERGVGAAALGHPAACVAWLADTLGRRGGGLAAGEVVLPGALHRAFEVRPGDVVTARFSDLGAVSVGFRGSVDGGEG